MRSDTSKQNIYLCFTGHEYEDGFEHVLSVLKHHDITGSFFLTGDFIRNHGGIVRAIYKEGHYVGAHSDKHLLYCDWTVRDSLLYSKQEIKEDIINNLKALDELGITSHYFMPPYEWYNEQVVEIASELSLITVNNSPGTRSNADYTTPDMPNYISSTDILKSIYSYEETDGMHGFHLLIHPGVSPKRKDKLYNSLDELVSRLKGAGYYFSRFQPIR